MRRAVLVGLGLLAAACQETHTGAASPELPSVERDAPEAVVTAAEGGADVTPPTQVEAEVAGPSDLAAPSDASPPTASCEHAQVVTLLEAKGVALALGLTAPITFQVPEGALAVTVTVESADGHMLGLSSWDAAGVALVHDGWQENWENGFGVCMDCKNRFALAESAFATLAPNAPDSSAPPGTHTLVVLAQAQPEGWGAATPGEGAVDVTVLAKLPATAGDAPAASGVLDLNLHFTGARGWTASGAGTNQELAALLAKVAEIYAQVGLELGLVTFHDVDAKYQVIESIQGKDSDLGAMFASAAPGRPQALDLFFVEEIKGGFLGGFGVILGISGGIPGPPLAQGTPRSGVAIALEEVEGAPAGPDTTTAHEMGHFLGLFHTVEVLGTTDPLPDTGEGPEWLMHNQGGGTELSPLQGGVMRSNPWVCSPEGAP